MASGPWDTRSGPTISQAVEEFLTVKRQHCAKSTVSTYQWALWFFRDLCEEDGIAHPPRDPDAVARLVDSLTAYSSHSKRNLWDTLRDFYSWLRDTDRNPTLPELPGRTFSRRRRGEKRGGRRAWQEVRERQ